MKTSWRNFPVWILKILGLCCLAGLPLVIENQYVLHVLINIFLVTLPAVGLRLILITGNMSFGQVAFVAIGAYTSTLLVVKLGLSTWVALPMAGFVSAVFGAAIGWPALRIRGTYFAILTLCMGQAVIKYIENLPALTGGSDGIFGIPRPGAIEILGHPIIVFTSAKENYYYLALALFLFSMLLMSRIERSRLGRIFHALGQHDSLAKSVGIPALRYKVLAFSIGCFLSGLGGAFYAHYFRGVHPENFTVWDSIYYVVYTIVGGVGSIWGPFLGASAMLGFFEVSRSLTKLQPILYAVVFIVVILFLPEGLVSIKDRLLHAAKRLAPIGGGGKNDNG